VIASTNITRDVSINDSVVRAKKNSANYQSM